MAKGRPVGSTNTPQFRNYVTEEQRAGFVKWVIANYKKYPKLAMWFGDQNFGKAVQPISNPEGKSFVLSFDDSFKHDDSIAPGTKKNRSK